MENILMQAGLSEPQAKAYLHLLRQGEQAPPAVAEALQLTRSNAYKILDKLTELGLLLRREVDKKFVYRAEDPAALGSLIASQRSRLLELEKNVKGVMHELRSHYQRAAGGSEVQLAYGTAAVAAARQAQAKQRRHVRTTQSPASGVEWCASESELLIIHPGAEPSALSIKNREIAKAFGELQRLLDKKLPQSTKPKV